VTGIVADAPTIEADAPTIQAALRLRLFHLLQTVSPHAVELDTGVPVHGWQGEAARGHVSWDELFLFPLLDLRVPEIARALLMYRFRRLDAARMVAAAEGARGARFPWRSGSNGREEAPRERFDAPSGRWRPDRSHLQAHVNSAVAYDVWHYYQATADHEFLSFYGAELVLEIARYWASRATLDGTDGRYHIRGVVGPDEYHDVSPDGESGDGGGGVDDNAYTNVMASWVLRCADRVLDRLPADRRAELCDQLEITDDELERWRETGRLLAVHFHDGVISQFDGYGRLPGQDTTGGGAGGVPGAADDPPVRYRRSSQPDVLMLLYLFPEPELVELLTHLGYDLDQPTIARTTRYYLERTAPHASPLTALVHARVLARTDGARSWSLLAAALARDVGRDGDGGDGIHVGAMAAAADVIQGGYLGVTLDDEALWLDPRLPESLAELRTKLRHRGQWLEVSATGAELCVVARDSGAAHPVRVGVAGTVHELHPGETLRVTTSPHSAHTPGRSAREKLALGVRH
jgi:alpha,alpha-trehalase